MTTRILLAALLLTGVTLAGCDGGVEDDPDGISGIWLGQVQFEIDTLVAPPAAVRIRYNADVAVELRLRHENGLVNGTMQRTSAGLLALRTAWGGMDSTDLANLEPTINAVYGTYDAETQKMDLRVSPRFFDHPTCGDDPIEYSENFLDFTIFGARGDGDAFVGETRNNLMGSDSLAFSFEVISENQLTIERQTDLPPQLRPIETDPRLLVDCEENLAGKTLTVSGVTF